MRCVAMRFVDAGVGFVVLRCVVSFELSKENDVYGGFVHAIRRVSY